MLFLKVPTDSDNWRVHWRISVILKFCLLLGAVLLFLQERYQAVAETLVIILITFLPLLVGRKFQVKIPHEFESLAIVLIYMSLFLGEVHGYYVRFWWWDTVLHTSSAFLLGILGFLLVYVLNENEAVELDLSPNFIAFFAFLFAMGMGTLWEIFEFFMDSVFAMNMQKSGLVDTMWDLIVDSVGALSIALLGNKFLKTEGSESFLEEWIDRFIKKNPQFFQKDK